LAFATLFLLALNFGGQTFPWKSAAVIVPLILSFLLVGLLIYVEMKFAKEPLMPPRLFKNRTVVSILCTNWFFGMTFFSAVYFLPVYFQVVRNDSAMWSGIRLIPMQLVICVLSTFAGIFISKTGIYRPLYVDFSRKRRKKLIDYNIGSVQVWDFSHYGLVSLVFMM
jgi:hypothetical protein